MRYKQIRGPRGVLHDSQRKRVTQTMLRYLLLTPRLQRLYVSNATASHITWHATYEKNMGIMHHPSDAKAWKLFDRTYLDFVNDSCNICLGLCVNGFAQHG